jgi:hypothetical protein
MNNTNQTTHKRSYIRQHKRNISTQTYIMNYTSQTTYNQDNIEQHNAWTAKSYIEFVLLSFGVFRNERELILSHARLPDFKVLV